jgi:Bacterial regulatory helix-turn-helix protein, lysR family
MVEKPKLSLVIGDNVFSYKLFESLECVAKTWSQRKAAKALGISHAVLNRRIKDAEGKLGFKLVETTGAGSGLTNEAFIIINRHIMYMNRLKIREKPIICGGHISSGLLEILSFRYGLDAMIYRTNDENALYLANMDMIDILTLDDPLYAFKHDLDFTPIAYDHLSLVSGDKPIIDLKDLNGKKFLAVPNSSQRLAWNTLDNKGIRYKIVEKVESPYTALKYIKNRTDLYTFLNNSFAEGSNIIMNDTKHIISAVLINKNNFILKDFLEFVLEKGQYFVEKCGFGKIK